MHVSLQPRLIVMTASVAVFGVETENEMKALCIGVGRA